MSKKRVVFDVAQLIEGVMNEGSGIFYVALNLFKEFSKNENIELVLYSSQGNVGIVQKWLQNKLDHNFECIGKDKLEDIIFNLKQKRKFYRKNKKYIHRIILDIVAIVLKILHRLKCIFTPLSKITGDVYFSPSHAIPEHINIQKKYIFLHDTIPLIFSEYFTNSANKWFHKMICCLPDTTKQFANSQATKKDFLKFFPDTLKDGNIIVAPLAAADTFYPVTDKQKISEVRQRYHIPQGKKYVFSLCTLEPRKNLIRAVKTFIEFIKKNNINDLVFVLGGAHWKEFITKMNKEIKDLGYFEDKIIQAGYVADEDLATLYSGAEWFVYTSQYEGFGLPPPRGNKMRHSRYHVKQFFSSRSCGRCRTNDRLR